MRRTMVLWSFAVTLAMVPVARGGHDMPKEGVQGAPDGGIEEMDRSREKACNCCQECQAAMGTTKGKEEGPPRTSGCRDCCNRCGKKLPMDKAVPPEIVR